MFRILGDKESEKSDKPPVLVQHGFGMDAVSWLVGAMLDKPWPLKLVDEGYDVWLGNNRGVNYSNKNDRDGEWSLEERWDFSWREMGTRDMPYQLVKVREVTGKEKATLIGYSQGSAQTIYGMAKGQDFYADYVDRFIAVAPCFAIVPLNPFPNDAIEFLDQYKAGEYFMPADPKTFTKPVDCSKSKDKDCTYDAGYPNKSLHYYN